MRCRGAGAAAEEEEQVHRGAEVARWHGAEDMEVQSAEVQRCRYGGVKVVQVQRW